MPKRPLNFKYKNPQVRELNNVNEKTDVEQDHITEKKEESHSLIIQSRSKTEKIDIVQKTKKENNIQSSIMSQYPERAIETCTRQGK